MLLQCWDELTSQILEAVAAVSCISNLAILIDDYVQRDGQVIVSHAAEPFPEWITLAKPRHYNWPGDVVLFDNPSGLTDLFSVIDIDRDYPELAVELLM